MISECITVQPTDALKSVKRECYTRKKNSCYGCYILEDKHGTYLIVAQKLHAIAAFLNSIAPDAASRIAVTTLYEILDNSNNRVGGFAKHRWRLRFALDNPRVHPQHHLLVRGGRARLLDLPRQTPPASLAVPSIKLP